MDTPSLLFLPYIENCNQQGTEWACKIEPRLRLRHISLRYASCELLTISLSFSVLESEREITVAESNDAVTYKAHANFRIIATMNPGGDFGKKEVNPQILEFTQFN